MTATTGFSRWTRRFVVASAISMVALQFAFLFDAPLRLVAVVGLFGAVLPMTFGMAYLLLPSYLGRTLSTRRLPGVHLFFTYSGVGLLLGHELLGFGTGFHVGGVLLWSAGVAVFVGVLVRTAAPVVLADPGVLRLSSVRTRRSTRLALVAIPIAIGYLIVGTVALLATADGFPDPLDATFPTIVHLYGTGFVVLLIFALGIRLLTGFFHVTPPRSLSWLVLSCGSVAPGVLAFYFYRPPWFTVGAILESVAVTAYAALVAVVAYRTDRRRIGIYGVGFGALGGVTAVGIPLASVLHIAGPLDVVAHVVVVLDGFLILTIVGYAYQFFPVTNRRFRGATERTGLATIFLVAAGTATLTVGVLAALYWLRVTGIVLAAVGTSGYAYLVVRRFL